MKATTKAPYTSTVGWLHNVFKTGHLKYQVDALSDVRQHASAGNMWIHTHCISICSYGGDLSNDSGTLYGSILWDPIEGSK